MPRPPITWLITDSHYNDPAMLKDNLRPMAYETLITKNCRKVIAPQDILIHLGDVIFQRPGELKMYLSDIPGKIKLLVRGNHDRQSDNWFIGQGFNFVADAIRIGNVLLTHQPQLTNLPADCINIHGHFHNFGFRTDEEKILYNPKQHKLLALEQTNYAPVNLREFALQCTSLPQEGQSESLNDVSPHEAPKLVISETGACPYCSSKVPCFDGITACCLPCQHPDCKIKLSQEEINVIISIWTHRLNAICH